MALSALFGFGVADSISELHSKDTNHGVTPEFLITLRPDIVRSKEEGRPIYAEVETVILHVAGDPWNAISKPVDEDVKRRFGDAYRNWTANRDENITISGTPLSQWPAITKAQVEELKALSIHNVEGLSKVADSNVSRSPSLRDLREKAIAYLAEANGGAKLNQLVEENSDLKARLEKLEALLATQANVKPVKTGKVD